MEDLVLLRKAWNTVLELAQDREFVVSPTYHELSDADFRHLVAEDKLSIFAEQPDKHRAFFCTFMLMPKVKPSQIKQLVDEIRSVSEYTNSQLEILMIVRLRPNNTVMKIEKEKNIQIMWIKQLQFNLTKHVLVPQHFKCSDEEADELMSKFGLIHRNQFPTLLKDDPVSRYYNFKSGDIIKIQNTSSPTNPNYLFYRVVK